MKSKARKITWALVALFLAGIGCIQWRVNRPARDAAHQTGPEAGVAREDRWKSNERAAMSSRPRPAAAPDHPALKGVKSPIARRYLAFLVAKDGRLADESYAPSIVNNAFAQAWIVTSRMELTAEQQDRLAEFLLEHDWLRWDSVAPAKLEGWASQNLSADQQATLKDFLAEQKEGAASMEELKQTIRRLEHGNRSEAAILAAEMAALKAFLAPDDGSDSKPPVLTEMDAETQTKHAAYVQTEQAFRYYNLLADRIPLTAEQHQTVYAALREGQPAPINPYAYQTLATDRAEAVVRKDTAWLGNLLTNAQYETYVRHFLAEIEMIRFQNSR
jgi:hypothetical protein